MSGVSSGRVRQVGGEGPDVTIQIGAAIGALQIALILGRLENHGAGRHGAGDRAVLRRFAHGCPPFSTFSPDRASISAFETSPIVWLKHQM